MDPAQQQIAGPVKRSICGLLSIGGFAALGVEIFNILVAGQLPSVGTLMSGISAAFGSHIFGLYAIRGHG